MVDAAYQGWRTDMLAGKTTLISTATNSDVTALSARAREDRVAAGQVETDGVQLADGNRAGRGDWIVTRKNNRKITTTRGRDFVKNGDAWEVVKRHKDGSLKVRHMDHRGRLTLPADYVAANVQLLYASTVMRSQGGTVDTAHPLVTEDMTREQLYVQLSRAREKTTVYTVTHELLAFDTDEQMDATRHDPDTFAAREVLERVLAREGAQHSATDSITEAQEEAVSLSTLVPRYDHATDTLTRQHYAQLTTTILGPDLGQNVTEDPAFSAVARALRAAQGQGWQPEQLLAAAARQGDLTAAESPAQLLAWRINQHTEDHQPTPHLHQPTAADATRYASPETALTTPSALRTVAASGTTPAGHPYVSAADLEQYAAAVAERTGTTTAAVAEHRDWPQLAAVLVAAHHAGHDTDTLLDTADARASRSDNPVHDLTTHSSQLLAQRGVPQAEHRVPAALRHQAAAHHALGDHLAEQARAEAAWPALTAAMRRAETAGHHPDQLLRQALEARLIDGADSISQILAWRINRYLAIAPAPGTDQRTTDRQAEQWRTLAWTLKATENNGTDLTHALTGNTAQHQPEQVLQHARTLQNASAELRQDLPGWVTAPQQDTAMDPAHRTYLDDRAQLIADRMNALAQRVTTDRPDWSQTLGDAPTDLTARATWTQHLATIAAYRDQYQVTDNNPAQPAGPYIEKGRAGHTAYWAAAASALAASNLARTGTVLNGTTPTPDKSARGQLAADVFQTLTPKQQQTVINGIATRTGATWLQHTPVTDSAALRFVTVVDPLTTVMTEHGHLTPESRPTPQEPAAPSITEASPAAEPSLAERRRAGRAAERAAHREQVQARNGRAVHSTPPVRRAAQPQEPAARADRRPQPPQQPTVQQPPRQGPEQQGPRIR